MARQRTFLELISVTGFMVSVSRDIYKDIGTRWLDSEHIVRFKIYDKKIKALEDKKAKAGLSPEEDNFYNSHLPVYIEAKKKYEELIGKYGVEFKDKYGWAKKALNEINERRVENGQKKLNLGHNGIREVTLPFLEHLHVLGNFAVHGGGEPTRSIYPVSGGGNWALGPTIYGIEYLIRDTSRLVGTLAAFVTFAFDNEDSAIASAVIKAVGSRSLDEIKDCIRKRELFLCDGTFPH